MSRSCGVKEEEIGASVHDQTCPVLLVLEANSGSHGGGEDLAAKPLLVILHAHGITAAAAAP
jgi:hypothetical protein